MVGSGWAREPWAAVQRAAWGGDAATGGGCLVNGGGDERGRTESGGGTGRSQGQIRSLDRDASRRRRRRARDGGHPGRDRRGGRSARLREVWLRLESPVAIEWRDHGSWHRARRRSDLPEIRGVAAGADCFQHLRV